MARPRRSRRTWVTLAVLILISISLITFDERGGTHHLTSGLRSTASDLFNPFRNAADNALDPIGNLFAGAVNYGSLQQENQKLRASLGKLRQQEAESGFQRRQERQLQQTLALDRLPYLSSLSTVTAQVNGLDVSNFASTIQIDKGRDDGVEVGMPAVGNGGLVGEVTQATHHSATITMINDGSSSVGVVLAAAPGSLATVDGEGPSKLLSANYIAPGTALRKGEAMDTNGLAGGKFPPGIPVARVVSWSTQPGATQMTVRVAPLADLNQLAYVDVVQWQPGS